MPVSGSYEPPCQFAPPVASGSISVASGPGHLLTTGGVKIGPILKRDTSFTASARSSGVKSIRSSIDTPCRSNAGGLVTKGCVGHDLLHRHVGLFDRPLLDRPDRLAGRAIEDIEPALLRRLRDDLAHAAVDHDVGEDRRARQVPIPDAVMNELVVPLALAGLEIDGHEALAEQVRRRDGDRRSSRRSASRRAG